MSVPNLPGPFRPGDKLRADELNQIVDGIAQVGSETGGSQPGGLSIVEPIQQPTPRGRSYVELGQWAKVVNAPAYAPTKANLIKYDVALLRNGYIEKNVTPYYGRPVKGDDIELWPAKIGDECMVMLSRDSEGKQSARLWILSEQVNTAACPP